MKKEMDQNLNLQSQKLSADVLVDKVQNLEKETLFNAIPYNQSLQNVKSSFDNLPSSGNLQTNFGGMLFANVVKSHIQGMALYNNQIGNFILLSHNDNTKNNGKLIAIDLVKGQTDSYDSENNFNHPSGIQVTGDFLVWPVSDSSSSKSYISFYDLSNFSPKGNDPVLLPNIKILRSKDSAAAGITYSNGSYVVAVYGSSSLDVYVSNQVKTLNEPTLKWGNPYTIQITDGWDCINLLTDMNGQIFLCGFKGEVGKTTIKDYAELYQLNISNNQPNLTLLSSRNLKVKYGYIKYLGGIHFRWGSGLKIENGNMMLYCSARNFLLKKGKKVLQWNSF